MGGAHVFSIACLACKRCRRPIVQAAVWSLFVVIMAPDGDLPSGVKQVLKPTDSRALFAQPPVKAFDMRVLRGLTGLDMHQLDLLLNAPCQEMPTGQLRAVVAANRPRSCAVLDDLVQHSCYAPAGEARIHFQRQALTRSRSAQVYAAFLVPFRAPSITVCRTPTGTEFAGHSTRHTSCASIRRSLAPRPRPSGLLPPAPAQRSSALPHACSSTCSALTPEYENRTRLRADLAEQVTPGPTALGWRLRTQQGRPEGRPAGASRTFRALMSRKPSVRPQASRRLQGSRASRSNPPNRYRQSPAREPTWSSRERIEPRGHEASRELPW